MSVKCYETDYKNYGKCLCLDNGIIKLIATIDVGPRIVFFGFADGDGAHVPEPSTWLLLILGVSGLAVYRKRIAR